MNHARTAILLATGSTKAPALAAMVEGPISVAVPATALRLHPDATVVCDGTADCDYGFDEAGCE